MSECIICFEEIVEDDPKGKAWLSCNCKQEYHALCLYRWLYTEEKIGLKKIIKSCPLCQGKNLYIEDFIPPLPSPPKQKVIIEPLIPKKKHPKPKPFKAQLVIFFHRLFR